VSRAYILQEDFQNTTGLFVDETRNTFDTTTAGQTTNSRLRDSCSGIKNTHQVWCHFTNLGCYHEEFYDDAWHHPFRDPGMAVRRLGNRSARMQLTFPPFPRPDIVVLFKGSGSCSCSCNFVRRLCFRKWGSRND
jgi:hypothetical protein